MTDGVGYKGDDKIGGMALEFIDVRRAYFHAEARREIYVEFPAEDQEEGMCGLLNKAMYGTRDAAQNWEYAYSGFLEGVGFVRGLASPCIFHPVVKELRVVVHGDDFTVLGRDDSLDWLRERIGEEYEVKFRGRLGPKNKHEKEIRLLSRVITWTEEGIEWEADQRHAEIIVRDLGLNSGSKGVSTPGTQERRSS